MSFNVFGVNIKVTFPAVAVLCLAVFSTKSGNVVILICLLCSLIHEAGHLIFICKYSGKPECIKINSGEISINCDLSQLSVKQDLIITSAGVCFNFITAFVFTILRFAVPISVFEDIAICSVCIGVFNLLPVKTFDGGQLLYNLLSLKLSSDATDRIMNILTVITVVPVATLGFYVLLISEFNLSMLAVAMYIITVIISKEMR